MIEIDLCILRRNQGLERLEDVTEMQENSALNISCGFRGQCGAVVLPSLMCYWFGTPFRNAVPLLNPSRNILVPGI